MENLKEYDSSMNERVGLSILPSTKVYDKTYELFDALIAKIKTQFNVDDKSALESIKHVAQYIKTIHRDRGIGNPIKRPIHESDMSYEDFFGRAVTHVEAFRKRIENEIIGIITDEKGISEKAFDAYDNVINMVRNDMTEAMCEEANEIWLQGKRIRYIGEMMYDKYFKK